jgi:hypothetical protein
MGRVDRVVLQVDTDQPPRVTGIEIGLPPLTHRLGRLTGCLADALVCAFGVSEGGAVRLPVAEILDIDKDVRVNVAVGKTAAAAIEQRLRRWVPTFSRRS